MSDDPLQAHGFATRRRAIANAREQLGRKAREGLAFCIVTAPDGSFGWVNDSWQSIKARELAARKPDDGARGLA